MTKEQRSAWRKANPELHREEQRRHYAKHKEKIKPKVTSYKNLHPELSRAHGRTRSARIRGAGGSFTKEEWFTLCFACDFRCLACGEQRPLSADHVTPVSKGGTSWLHNIQPLCTTCNLSKYDKYIDYRSSVSILESEEINRVGFLSHPKT